MVLGLAAAWAGTCAEAAELRTHAHRQGTVRACHVDLRKDDLRMFWAKSDGTPLGSLVQLSQALKDQGREIVCATNGGMYQEDLRPLGLYVEAGRVVRRLNTRKGAYGNFYMEPNGVFLLKDGQARIITTDEYDAAYPRDADPPRFATQSGPLMLQRGAINKLFGVDSKNRLIRNVACVVSPAEVVLAIADTPISFHEFSSFLRDQLKCTDALHLDSTISRLGPPISSGMGPAIGVMIAVTRERRDPAAP